MGSMESFYGGRQGASFVIVKTFDCIKSLGDTEEFKSGWFAVDAILSKDGFSVPSGGDIIDKQKREPVFILHNNFLIKRNVDNYRDFEWYPLEKCGDKDKTEYYTINIEDSLVDVSVKRKYVANAVPKELNEVIDSTTHTIKIEDGVPSFKKQAIPNRPRELKESMIDCFKKGGITTSEVNYGEYVIIDTIDGSGEYDNPDNGKVFRRGMDYNNDIGGAEYIGQIIGPQGTTPRLEMGTIAEIAAQGQDIAQSQIRFYKPADKMPSGYSHDNNSLGLVPGMEVKNNQKEYNDDIEYGWATIKDEKNNIYGSLIGFQFPYLVPEFTSRERSPYYTSKDIIPEGKRKGDLIDLNTLELIVNNEENPYQLFNPKEVVNPQEQELYVLNEGNYILSTDTTPVENKNYYKKVDLDKDVTHGDTGHPFYRKWKIEIPHGIKGDSITQLKVIPTAVRPGSPYWANEQNVGNDESIVGHTAGSGKPQATVSSNSALEYGKVKIIKDDLFKNIQYNLINDLENYNGDYVYVYDSNIETYKKILKTEVTTGQECYEQIGTIDYDDSDANNDWVRPKDDFNDQIGFNEDVIPPFTNPEAPIQIEYVGKTYWTQIKYVYKLQLKYVLTNYDNVKYGENTINLIGDYNTIYDVNLDKENGCFVIRYTADEDKYVPVKTLNDIYIESSDKMPVYKWDEENECFIIGDDPWQVTEDFKRRYQNIDGPGEGSGSQRVKVQYVEWNDENKKPEIKIDTIGEPLNYAMEYVVTSDSLKRGASTPVNHLFVLYSDPERRKKKLTENEIIELKQKVWNNIYPNVAIPGNIDTYSDNGGVFDSALETLKNNKIQEKKSKTTYKSDKYGVRDDWTDLGEVGNKKEGLHIIDNIVLATNEGFDNVLDNILKNTYPPEILHMISIKESKITLSQDSPEEVLRFKYTDSRLTPYQTGGRLNYQAYLEAGNLPDYEYEGYAYSVEKRESATKSTVKLYIYSYKIEKWSCIGEVGYKEDPTNFIILDSEKVNGNNNIVPSVNEDLRAYGIWLVKNEIKTAY